MAGADEVPGASCSGATPRSSGAAARTEAPGRVPFRKWLNTRFSTTATIAAALIPECMIVANQVGKASQKVGAAIGMMPTPMAVATITRFRPSPYSTRDSVRMPLAATVPNRTMPAPPRTDSGMAATTRPTTGSRPSRTRMSPPVATT